MTGPVSRHASVATAASNLSTWGSDLGIFWDLASCGACIYQLLPPAELWGEVVNAEMAVPVYTLTQPLALHRS